MCAGLDRDPRGCCIPELLPEGLRRRANPFLLRYLTTPVEDTAAMPVAGGIGWIVTRFLRAMYPAQ